MADTETLEMSEADAIEEAVHEVADLLKDAKSLEMIEQHIYRMKRKKDMVETRLKEAVEAQLRGVRTGLFNLQKVMREAKEISTSMKSVNTTYKELNEQLGAKAREIKDTRVVHKEHALLHSYLQSIYNFKDDVDLAHNLLSRDELLGAHEILMKLEDCRDGIFKEVMNENIDAEKREKVEQFFSGLENLNKAFVKKIQFFLTRSLNSIRSGNTWKLVSTLRIIEREEKKDAIISRETEANPSLSCPERPKRWKKLALDYLSESIVNTFEGVWELDQSNETWIIRFAQKIKGITEQDLRVVDQHLQQCFPPSWEILEYFCAEYVRNIKQRFEVIIEKIQSSEGQASSYTIVYNWTTVLDNIISPYREKGRHSGVLSPGDISKLVSIYTTKLDVELKKQTEKILKMERDSRYEFNVMPDHGAGLDLPNYSTTTPVIFYEMINQNLEFAFKLESDLELIPVLGKLDSIIVHFIDKYVEDLKEFRDKYFTLPDEEKEDMHYLEWLLSSANNAVKCATLNDELVRSLSKKRHKDISGLSVLDQKRLIVDKSDLYLSKMLQQTCEYLSSLVFSDFKPILPMLYTQDWTDKKCFALARATLDDYYQSFFQFVMPPGNIEILKVISRQLLLEYLVTLLNTKSLSLSTDAFKDMLLEDHEQICNLFENSFKLGKNFQRKDFECLQVIAELVSESEDLVHIVMADFVNRYPDLRWEQCVAVLALRGDLNRETIREMVSGNGISETPPSPEPLITTMFTEVHRITGPLSSRFFQTVVAPRAAGFKTTNLNSSVTGHTARTSFSNISTNISSAVSNSPVYQMVNQAWNDKEQIGSRVARALEFGNAEQQAERTNPFYDPREDKGPAPRPPVSGGKGPAPAPPQRRKGSINRPRVSTNPFDSD